MSFLGRMMNRDQLAEKYYTVQRHLVSDSQTWRTRGLKERRALREAVRPEVHAMFGDRSMKGFEISDGLIEQYLKAKVHRRNRMKLDFRSISGGKGKMFWVMTPAEHNYIEDFLNSR